MLINAMLQVLLEKLEKALLSYLDFTEKLILSPQHLENQWEVHQVVL